MKTKLLYIACFCFGLNSFAQTYLQPSVGINSSYSGGCPISSCSGNYYDNGGSGGNYSNNINNIYQTFCPNTAGKCLKVTFSSFALENGYDYLQIANGPAQNSTVFATAPSSYLGIYSVYGITGTPTVPFSYTANNSSGCLTFRFKSDGSNTNTGWVATFSCVTCAATLPADNSDCSAPVQICSNSSLTDISSGPGINANEGCAGSCLTGETYSNWYVFSPSTSGSLSLAINPNVSTDDLDFAIYGPGASCGSLGAPIRCSFAGINGSTGMSNAGTSNSEGASGNTWVNPLNVTAGQVYYLLINNWTAGGSGYGLNFTGSTASLNCVPLPIELISFKGEAMDTYNTLSWKTASESNNDFYTLERSMDGTIWSTVSKVSGSKNSDFELSYSINDEEFVPNVVNYYRLSQTDFNGKTSVLKTISLINDAESATITRITNFLGQEVNSDYDGLRIIQYSDGSVVKKVGK